MKRIRGSVNNVSEMHDAAELVASKFTKNINDIHISSLTKGEILADRLADFVGSWTFIVAFFFVLSSWIILNSVYFLTRPFDPFPFILLNLLLSCLAAIQAPLIMMSQNRQEAKDRLRAEHDYEINLKTEIVVEEMLNILFELEKNQKEMKDLSRV